MYIYFFSVKGSVIRYISAVKRFNRSKYVRPIGQQHGGYPSAHAQADTEPIMWALTRMSSFLGHLHFFFLIAATTTTKTSAAAMGLGFGSFQEITGKKNF